MLVIRGERGFVIGTILLHQGTQRGEVLGGGGC